MRIYFPSTDAVCLLHIVTHGSCGLTPPLQPMIKSPRSCLGTDASRGTIVDNFMTIHNRHTGEILRLWRVRDAQGQIVLNLDGSLPPRAGGPPLHVHFHQREEGQVKAGTLGAQVGKEKIAIPAGGSAVFAAGTRHKWWNAGDDLLVFSG